VAFSILQSDTGYMLCAKALEEENKVEVTSLKGARLTKMGSQEFHLQSRYDKGPGSLCSGENSDWGLFYRLSQ